MIIIEWCDDSVWPERERFWIAELRRIGLRLLNLADGGDEPHCPREVRVANAYRVGPVVGPIVAAHHRDPAWKEVWELNRYVGQELAAGRLTYRNKLRIKLCALMAPQLFGKWANIV